MEKHIIKLIGSYLNVLSYVSPDYAANKALHIFSKPRKGKLTRKQEVFLNSAKKEVLHYDDLKIATYHWKGDKATILLAHGWESNSARWKNKIDSFINEGFNVIALDAPAHGASESKSFNALLYSEFINIVAQKHQPQIVIGHSVGGMSLVFYQQKYQLESIQKMVLLGAPSEFEDILKNYINLLGYNKKIENSLSRIIINRFGAAPTAFSTSKFVKDIATEGLIIHDVKDPIIPFSDAKLITSNYKNSTLISTKGLGHSLNSTSVTKSIVDFIKS
ncbi:alpha/beta fold hydrolase [Flavobacteriaceae bacterium S0825]|uniref:alpha/beta hydrolase n=1 Tax=Gaetbulibacter sp. S0825 TaxID=2720084 RepID=UPI001431BDE1|nr:alpha/beta hydrolase [Gaetbulibacter sp. S0825]MCK0108833.1 alpha/beta fold hydrolase [Flavobacteriaceae bacterium S0825]NIX64469.1 alpha/beta hydrolase [Gaetbulibacter sp. S0825]